MSIKGGNCLWSSRVHAINKQASNSRPSWQPLQVCVSVCLSLCLSVCHHRRHHNCHRSSLSSSKSLIIIFTIHSFVIIFVHSSSPFIHTSRIKHMPKSQEDRTTWYCVNQQKDRCPGKIYTRRCYPCGAEDVDIESTEAHTCAMDMQVYTYTYYFL